MKKSLPVWLLIAMMMFAGCATMAPKAVVWETWNIPMAYEVIGPVSVTEQISESPEDTVAGIAGFISKDGRISSQMPPDMKAALDAKSEKHKDWIFEKLGAKAKSYNADAVIGVQYLYVPSFASFSTKATVSAKGTMVRYKN